MDMQAVAKFVGIVRKIEMKEWSMNGQSGITCILTIFHPQVGKGDERVFNIKVPEEVQKTLHAPPASGDLVEIEAFVNGSEKYGKNGSYVSHNFKATALKNHGRAPATSQPAQYGSWGSHPPVQTQAAAAPQAQWAAPAQPQPTNPQVGGGPTGVPF